MSNIEEIATEAAAARNRAETKVQELRLKNAELSTQNVLLESRLEAAENKCSLQEDVAEKAVGAFKAAVIERDKTLADVVALREALIEVQKIVHFAPGSDVEVLESVAAKVDAILASPNPGQGLLDVVKAAHRAMYDGAQPCPWYLARAVRALGEQANKPRTLEPVD